MKKNNNIDQYASTLAKSFHNDPLFVHFFPDKETRFSLSFFTFRFILAHALSKGYVFSSSDLLEGVSIWLPSSYINRNLIDQIRFGALGMLLRQGKEIIHRQKEASYYMRSIHMNLLSKPHIYLSTLGVQEEFRGKGFARSLLEKGFELANQFQLPCYLDTHNESNIEFYNQFGFSLVHKGKIPNSNVNHWAMIKYP